MRHLVRDAHDLCALLESGKVTQHLIDIKLLANTLHQGLMKHTCIGDDADYITLRSVLDRAYQQASEGKGKERHAQDLPFDKQPMQSISALVGSDDGLRYQAIKKIQESKRLHSRSHQVAELLGAINYIAGVIIFIEARGNSDAGHVISNTQDHLSTTE